MFVKSNLLAILLTIILCVHNIDCAVDVNTTSGVVRGLTIDVLNTSVDQFLNIPFAEPPIGSLRFAKPLPLKAPKKVRIKY